MQTGTYKLKHNKNVAVNHCAFTLPKDSLIKVDAIDRWSGKVLIVFDNRTKDWFHSTWLADNAELQPLSI